MGKQQAALEEALTRAALDPDAWHEVMDAIAVALPGARPHLLGYDVTMMRNVPQAYAGYDGSFAESYRNYYANVNPYIPSWTTLPVGRVVFSEEVFPERELVRTEYYNDWLRPQDDLRTGGITVLSKDPGRMFMLGTHIEGRAEGRIIPKVLSLMTRYYPLMRHALDINRMTMGLRIDAELLREGIEPDGAAILLVSGAATILYVNTSGERMLAAGQVVRCDLRGRLTFSDPASELRLRAVLRSDGHRGSPGFRVGPGPQETEVRLLPVTPDTVARLELPLLLRTPPPALLVVLRPATTAADEALPLMRRFGLTRAEAEVALAIAEGASAAEVAELRGVSIHTVHKQTKAVMAKTEVRRRSALVKIVLDLRRSR